MKYTKGQTQEGHVKLVCHINSLEEHLILNEIYPWISTYSNQNDCYLLANGGSGNLRDNYQSPEYKIVEFNELINPEYEIY